MWKEASVACSSCENHDNCTECRAYFQSSLAYKSDDSKSPAKLYPRTYKRITTSLHESSVEKHTMCDEGCDSKSCHTCRMYNTKFIING